MFVAIFSQFYKLFYVGNPNIRRKKLSEIFINEFARGRPILKMYILALRRPHFFTDLFQISHAASGTQSKHTA